MRKRWEQLKSRGWWPPLPHVLRGQAGVLLAEVIVAFAVFTILGTAVLVSLQTGILANRQFQVDSTAENLVRNQMAYVLEQPYMEPGDFYTPIPAPPGFLVVTDVLPFGTTSNDDLSRIRITVTYNGEPLKVMETVRSNE